MVQDFKSNYYPLILIKSLFTVRLLKIKNSSVNVELNTLFSKDELKNLWNKLTCLDFRDL